MTDGPSNAAMLEAGAAGIVLRRQLDEARELLADLVTAVEATLLETSTRDDDNRLIVVLAKVKAAS
jgi:hypothetical protein